ERPPVCAYHKVASQHFLVAQPPLLCKEGNILRCGDSWICMGIIEATLLLLLITTMTVRWARRTGMPIEVLLVLGSLAFSLLPGLPRLILDPTLALIIKKLGVPRRMLTVIEGESLVNDATALVAYRFALGAIVTGSSLAESAFDRFPYED